VARSIDRRLRDLEHWEGGGDRVYLEQLDGSMRSFPTWECWAAMFSARLDLVLEKPTGPIFDALRGTTDKSRELFAEEFGEIKTTVVGRAEEGIWAEVYEYDLDTDAVISTYLEPGSEDAQAVFDSTKRREGF
jgi:hypothetical protein